MVTAQTQHPTQEQLAAFGQGRLSEAEMAVVEAHVGTCSSCCEFFNQAPDDKLGLLARAAHGAPAETVILQGPDTDAAPLSSEKVAEPALPDVPSELAEHPRYQILKVIGKGGMGVVFKAEHRMMQRPVALKVINQRFMANTEAIERFHQEVRAAARLSHPNIVAAFDAEQAGNLHFLVMEFVEGKSLAQWVQQRGPLSVVQACNAIRQVCVGLQHAHERGMTHRDIKPQNLMLAKSGKIKILDFGLARFEREQLPVSPTAATESELTAFGTVLGTPDYMAPEQATDSRLADARSDIFSLGCTLFFLLTGRSPFEAGSFTAMVLKGVQRTMVPLKSLRSDLPDGLIALVGRLMATRPSDRFATVAEVAEALVPFGRGEKVGASGSSDSKTPDEAGQAELQGLIAGDVSEPVAEVPLPKTRVSKSRRALAETAVFEPRVSEEPAANEAEPDEEYQPLRGRSRSRGRRSRPNWQARLRGVWQHPVARIGVGVIAVLMLLGIANSFRSSVVEPVTPVANNVARLDGGRDVSVPNSSNGDGQRTDNAQPTSTAASVTAVPAKSGSKVLFVLAAWSFWWPDYEPTRRLLEDAGVQVTVASWQRQAQPLKDGGGSNVRVDVLLSDVVSTDYDAVIFCGGPGALSMATDSPQGRDAERIINEMMKSNRLVTAVCMGPAVLAKVGLLNDIPATGSHYIHDKCRQNFGVTLRSTPVERTGNIITGCDDKTIPEFTAVLLKALAEKR